MTSFKPNPEAVELDRQLDQCIARLTELCTGIAAKLVQPEVRDEAQTIAAMREIDQIVRGFFPLVQRISQARTAHKMTAPVAAGRAAAALGDDELQWIRLAAKGNEIRTWLSQWHAVERLIKEQIPSRPLDLVAPLDDLDPLTRQQIALTNDLLSDLRPVLNPAPQSEQAQAHGCHTDISLPQSVFMKHAHAAYRARLVQSPRGPSRFIDVGCGSGLKLFAAARMFDRVDGLEFDPSFVQSAKKALANSAISNCEVIEGDALTFDHYDRYDVVYFYQPMRHQEQLRQMEDRIVQSVRLGTLLIAPYWMFERRYTDLGCAHLAGAVYVAGATRAEADELRRLAELTGPSIRARRAVAASVWNPIFEASQAKGFGI